MPLQQHAALSPQTRTGPSLSSSNRRTGTRSDSLLLGAMEAASLSVQPQEGSSRIQSRDASGAVGRGRSASRARPSWLRRALGGLLMWKQPAAVEAPARERAPTESERTPHWRSSLKKAVGSALARVACICEPVCSGAHDDDVVEDPRKSRRRRRRRGIRSPPGESDDYWTYAFRGRSSLVDDVLMRRYVMQEDAMRRRMEMRLAAGYGHACWFPPGPSRLSQMSLADDDDNDNDDEAVENSSTSPQCSEALSF